MRYQSPMQPRFVHDLVNPLGSLHRWNQPNRASPSKYGAAGRQVARELKNLLLGGLAEARSRFCSWMLPSSWSNITHDIGYTNQPVSFIDSSKDADSLNTRKMHTCHRSCWTIKLDQVSKAFHRCITRTPDSGVDILAACSNHISSTSSTSQITKNRNKSKNTCDEGPGLSSCVGSIAKCVESAPSVC